MIINCSKTILLSISADDGIMEEQEKMPLHRFLNITVTEQHRKHFIPYPEKKPCYVS